MDVKQNYLKFMTDLKKLKYLNLSNNELNSLIQDDEGWADFTQLEIIELQNNQLFGELPLNWKHLSALTYINTSYNSFTGLIPILSDSQKLEGIDFSGN